MAVKKEECFELLKSLEAVCLQIWRDIAAEAFGRSGGAIRDYLLSTLLVQWCEDTLEELKGCFSDLTSSRHAASQLGNLYLKNWKF